MIDYTQDKEAEKSRYAGFAAESLAQDDDRALGPDGALALPLELRTPYLVYEQHIRRIAKPGMQVLDVCCGPGTHSLVAGKCGASVTATDLVEGNVRLTERRAKRAGLDIQVAVADAESLPFEDGSFDLITCAGSLSYVDHSTFFRHIKRLLKPGGYFVCVDSLNHSPIYRLNRYIHYINGRRSRSTLLRMPRLQTIRQLGDVLGDVRFSCHGIFSFVHPALTPLLGSKFTTRLLDGLDRALPFLAHFGFKVVAIARKNVSN
jgi:2-polyprenyl-3-methyl-5-hydroxy-6-metoxy-1,4-benzoquinol methylase